MNYKRYQQGFSLAETMIAAGLFSVVFAAAIGLFNIVNRDTDKSVERLETSINRLGAEALIKKDLQFAKHSLNRLQVKDDSGEQFYEFLRDKLCDNNCERIFTIEAPKKAGEISKAFYILQNNPFDPRSTFYNPANAFNTTGALVFRSLDVDGLLSTDPLTPWKKGQLVLLHSSAVVTNRYDRLTFSSVQPSYLGWVTTSEPNSKLKRETIGGVYVSETLVNSTSHVVNTSEEQFLKNLPYVAGLGHYLMIDNARVIKYEIRGTKNGRRVVGTLVRSILRENGTWHGIDVAFNLKNIQFNRKSIDSPAISVKMEVVSFR